MKNNKPVAKVEAPAASSALPVITFAELVKRYAGSSHDVGGIESRLNYLAGSCKAKLLVLFADPKGDVGGQSVLCAGPDCHFKTIEDIKDELVQGVQKAVAYCAL